MKVKTSQLDGVFQHLPVVVKTIWTGSEFGLYQKGAVVEVDADIMCRNCPCCEWITPVDSWDEDTCGICGDDFEESLQERIENYFDPDEGESVEKARGFFLPRPFWKFLDPNGEHPEKDVVE